MVFITPDSFMEKSRNEKSAGVQMETFTFSNDGLLSSNSFKGKMTSTEGNMQQFFPLEKKKLHNSYQGMLKYFLEYKS